MVPVPFLTIAAMHQQQNANSKELLQFLLQRVQFTQSQIEWTLVFIFITLLPYLVRSVPGMMLDVVSADVALGKVEHFFNADEREIG